MPSASASACEALATAGQLSALSATPSPSASTNAAGAVTVSADRRSPVRLKPPATSTLPLPRSVAVGSALAAPSAPAERQVSEAGS